MLLFFKLISSVAPGNTDSLSGGVNVSDLGPRDFSIMSTPVGETSHD